MRSIDELQMYVSDHAAEADSVPIIADDTSHLTKPLKCPPFIRSVIFLIWRNYSQRPQVSL